MVRPLVRDEEGLSNFWSFIGLLVLVVAILAVYYGVFVAKFGSPAPRALPGDTVSVDYIGTFENGLVFDTSYASVANDNASHPKAFAFSWRPSFSSLTFEIGAGRVIRGFDLAVEGLRVGDLTTVRVPPSEGYGPADPAKIQVKPVFESVPAKLTMNVSAFEAKYGTPPVGGASVKDPFWGWTSTVDVAGTVITVTNSPSPGDLVHPRGAWDARVLSIDSAADGGVGRIQVQHLLDASSVDTVGHRTPGGAVEFVVTAVDLDAGTYTLNFNEPTKGRVLVFQVTLVRIAAA